MDNPENFEAFASHVGAALAAGNWVLVAALGLILAVYLVRKLAGNRFPFLASPRGGALLALVSGVLSALAAAFSGNVALSAALVVGGLKAGLLAAGGWSTVRTLIFGDTAKEAIQAAEAKGLEAGLASKASAPTVDSILGPKS